MDTGSIDELRMKHGEKPTWEHLDRLDRRITQNNSLAGSNVRRRVMPWGTTSSYFGISTGGSSPIFRPGVTFQNGVAQVRWSGPTAMIGGVVPTISKASIFSIDNSTGQTPFLAVKPSDFNPTTGEVGIYFQLTCPVITGYSATVVTPVALPSLPAVTANTAFKLALFLRMRNGQMTYQEQNDRALFCSQGFLAVNINTNGKFESLFWATF